MGLLKHKALLHWGHDNKSCGFARGFGRLSTREHFVLVRLCKQCDAYWWSRTEELTIVNLAKILFALCPHVCVLQRIDSARICGMQNMVNA